MASWVIHKHLTPQHIDYFTTSKGVRRVVECLRGAVERFREIGHMFLPLEEAHIVEVFVVFELIPEGHVGQQLDFV